MLVVASRIHWNNHAGTSPIDSVKALQQVTDFFTQAATYGDAIVLAVGVPPATVTSETTANPFLASIQNFVLQLPTVIQAHQSLHNHHERERARPVRIVPLTYWGQFVPALNALVATASTEFPDATQILFQSLEIQIQHTGIDYLRSKLDHGTDLVVGAALPGHLFSPEQSQPLPLDGVTTPWNTLAVWDLRKLAKIGFPLVGDGLTIGTSNAGVEEVSAIALFQQLYPTLCNAKVVAVPGLAWHVASFENEERRAWHQRKMDSKRSRPAKQVEHLGIPSGVVYHLL